MTLIKSFVLLTFSLIDRGVLDEDNVIADIMEFMVEGERTVLCNFLAFVALYLYNCMLDGWMYILHCHKPYYVRIYHSILLSEVIVL